MERVIWKDIKGYEGYYQVSSHGQVRSLDRIIMNGGYPRKIKGKILAQTIDRDGYKHLRLRKNGREKSFFVHRLVAEAFVHNKKPNQYVQVNHIDEDKANNHYSNLEWCTQEYNLNYGTRNQRISKPVIAFNKKETLYFSSMTEAAYEGFNLSCVSAAARGKLKTHKGYQWKLA
ncbi:NUMOD4 motif-containing HNH endonuclease [Lysinibacillus capsici]|uniref:NUMOD4 motif-containing HNH endonuclease n=1 Tax=Lysinibacillus capsici TaxID=2115968 RepID=UPI0032E47756